MKKRILGIAVVAIALTASWILSQNEAQDLPDFASLNVEALANPIVVVPPGNYYITDVTETSHSCHTGGPFSCDI